MEHHRVDGRKLSHEVLENYRLRAMELRKMGKSVKEIAFFFGLHPNSVSRWFVKYRRGGIDAIRRRKVPGPVPKLTLEEAEKILNCLKKPATEYGFPDPSLDLQVGQAPHPKRGWKELHGSRCLEVPEAPGPHVQKAGKEGLRTKPEGG